MVEVHERAKIINKTILTLVLASLHYLKKQKKNKKPLKISQINILSGLQFMIRVMEGLYFIRVKLVSLPYILYVRQHVGPYTVFATQIPYEYGTYRTSGNTDEAECTVHFVLCLQTGCFLSRVYI